MATENDKVNTGALATLVVVGTASMIGISLAVNALVRHEVGSVGLAREGQGELAYRDLKTKELQRLSSPAALSDAGTGHVSIPIERAMTLVLTDLKRSPWNATPAPPPDAGTDAAAEAADAGAEAADAGAEAADAGADAAPEASDAGPTPEPPGSTPLTPLVPPGGKPGTVAPSMRPSATPRPPGAPTPTPTPAAPSAAAPPAAPTPPASPAPPATP
jgi:hypothetical protein